MQRHVERTKQNIRKKDACLLGRPPQVDVAVPPLAEPAGHAAFHAVQPIRGEVNLLVNLAQVPAAIYTVVVMARRNVAGRCRTFPVMNYDLLDGWLVCCLPDWLID